MNILYFKALGVLASADGDGIGIATKDLVIRDHGGRCDAARGLDLQPRVRRAERLHHHRYRRQHDDHPPLTCPQRPPTTRARSPAMAATISRAPLSVCRTKGALRTS